MKKIVTTLFCAFTASLVAAQPSKQKLDSLMSFYANEYNFNGVALISYKGQVLLEKGYGYRDIEKQTKNDKNTVFQIGSNTKQFTAEIILQLAKEKKLEVHDKLNKYFPAYPSGDKITLENLLTHTSGIYNYTEDTSWQKDASKPITKQALMAIFENHPLVFNPGEKFEYSNSNYILLGYIIEQVTGKKYEQVVRERVLKPLGMTHSGFDFIHLKSDNKASGYYTIQSTKFDPAPVADSTVTFAAGGLYSTADDLLKWHNAVWSYKLLPKDWQDKAFKPFKDRYGYGWFIDTGYGKTHIGHSGGVPGYYTYVMNIPEDNASILLLQNCELPYMDNNTICINILKAIYEKDYKIPTPKKGIALSNEILQQYAGTYEVMPDFSVNVFIKDNKLFTQATDQDAFPMDAQNETRFFNKEVGIEIEFKKENDKVSKMIIFQSGQKIPALKKS